MRPRQVRDETGMRDQAGPGAADGKNDLADPDGVGREASPGSSAAPSE